MSAIIDEFEKVCKENCERKAFYYIEAGKVMSRTFAEMYDDVEKTKTALINNGLKAGDKLLAFASPDYHLLVYMLAVFKLGASIMYVDIFAKQDSLMNFFERFRPDYVLVSNKTRLVKPFYKYARGVKMINVDKTSQRSETMKHDVKECKVGDDAPALITATTGSSSKPKTFVRSHEDLFRQLSLIHDNIKISGKDEVILTTSYIYALANLMQGFTTVLPNINLALKKNTNGVVKKLSLLRGLSITTIMTSPDYCLRLPNMFPKLKQLYFGGAILNHNEARAIRSRYDGADIWYIYGSTECALISGVSLREYSEVLEKTGECLLGDVCKGVKVRIGEDGHILVSSEALLRRELGGEFTAEYYDINDAGCLKGGRLYYLGKAGTEVNLPGGRRCYANEIEQRVCLEFPELSKCAVVEKRGALYAFVEGDANGSAIKDYLMKEYGIINVVKLRQIPRDAKHHTKINYAKLRRLCRQYLITLA